MTVDAPGRTDLPGLPHWETTPGDLRDAIRQVKAALRARIRASGRTVEEVFAVIEQRVRRQAGQIAAEKARGETGWPVIDYADIAAGIVPPDQLAKLRRRGCLIVRGHFDHDQARSTPTASAAAPRAPAPPAWAPTSTRARWTCG